MSIAMIKGMAKTHMRGKRLLMTVGYILLLTLWVMAGQILIGVLQLPSPFDFMEAALDGRLGMNAVTLLFPVLLILLFILGDMMHMSYRWFGLDTLAGKSVEIKDVFQGFQKDNLKRLLSLVTLRFVIVLGWSLLFVLPGIWKAYLYSQAPNLMKQDKSLTAREALTKSEEVMKGNGWKYALVQVTFAPWYAVPALLFVYFVWSNRWEIEVAFETGTESAELIFGLIIAVFFMVVLLLFLFSLYVEPVKMMTKQVFYNVLMNHKKSDEYDDYEEVLLERQGLNSKRNSRRNKR